MSGSIESAIESDVVELHRFFEEWFHGRVEASDAGFARFADAMAPGFRIVAPSGVGSARGALLEELFAAHGANDVEIAIDDVQARAVAEGLWLVGYREWQRTPGAAWDSRSRQVASRIRSRVDGLAVDTVSS